MAQTSTSQIGPNAIAHPPVDAQLNPVPELHHLKDEPKETSESQLGPNAVAPPADCTAEDESDLIFHDLPPFPDDVPTAPLLRLSLQKLVDNDPKEVERLWRASCDVGFFYLDLRGAIESDSKRDGAHDFTNGQTTDGGRINGDGLLKDAADLFELGEKVYDLPVEEKQKYDFRDKGIAFGYKGLGAGIVDSKGMPDRNEFYNVSKDDILSLSDPLPAPDILQQDENRTLLKNYMQRSHAIITLLLAHLNTQLGLPPSTLPTLHRLQGLSGDQIRWVKSPPQPEDDRRNALTEHTDFGSMTILFNRLGGLQILPPDSEQWCYVKPLKGHCVCNLGDAMVKFTAGILRSNIQRVVNPPGLQEDCTRLSLVYFSRPEDEVFLQNLSGSAMIDEKRARQVEFKGEEPVTAKEWTLRRSLGRRAGGNYADTMGTENDRKGR